MKHLTHEINLNIRFSDTDAMGVVWHGNYLRFFEDAREAFGKKYRMDYLDIYHKGFFTPIVKVDIDYKWPLNYGDEAKIITKLIQGPAAKIVFHYQLINLTHDKVSATGKTVQIFLNAKTRNLELAKPQFYEKWEKETGIKF
jgi:acyl-CoA thioester hydrolase